MPLVPSSVLLNTPTFGSFSVMDEKTLVCSPTLDSKPGTPQETSVTEPPPTPPQEPPSSCYPAGATDEKVLCVPCPSLSVPYQDWTVPNESWSREPREPRERTSMSGASTAKVSYLSTSTSTRSCVEAGGKQGPFSKYNRASYSLTHHPKALQLYRDMAEKTKDAKVQFNYAMYLLEIASLYDTPTKNSKDTTSPRTSLEVHRCKKKQLEQEGVRWIKQLEKRKVGEAVSMMALWTDKGNYGIKKNPTKAMQLYRAAAKEKVPQAMYAVGKAEEKAGHWAVALTWYENAATAGEVRAMERMAKAHLLGHLNQTQNSIKALDLLSRCASKATKECPESPYLLGQLLTHHHQIKLSHEIIELYGGWIAALSYLELSASLNYIKAHTLLGKIHGEGLCSVPMHYQKSFYHYEIAAKGDQPEAMLGLSYLYMHNRQGPGDTIIEPLTSQDVSGWLISTPVDEDKAFYWCQVAARQHYPQALFLLGWYYEVLCETTILPYIIMRKQQPWVMKEHASGY
ncbi:hypothetical protein BDF14DRAFT_1740667 [Spinellus fusiger]|nr:hypothetical protein BDF14DRAFT_1740667 [Spinellus fusiger]